MKEEIIQLKNSLEYSNKEVKFLKFEIEKMRQQIDQLTNINKEMSVQLNDWRQDVKKRLLRLEEQLNKPYNEERIEKNVNVSDKEEEQQPKSTKPDMVPDLDAVDTGFFVGGRRRFSCVAFGFLGVPFACSSIPTPHVC